MHASRAWHGVDDDSMFCQHVLLGGWNLPCTASVTYMMIDVWPTYIQAGTYPLPSMLDMNGSALVSMCMGILYPGMMPRPEHNCLIYKLLALVNQNDASHDMSLHCY